jgi:hypothetical protein
LELGRSPEQSQPQFDPQESLVNFPDGCPPLIEIFLGHPGGQGDGLNHSSLVLLSASGRKSMGISIQSFIISLICDMLAWWFERPI